MMRNCVVGFALTQFSLLRYVSRLGEVRQRDLGKAISLDETDVDWQFCARLIGSGWVEVNPGDDSAREVDPVDQGRGIDFAEGWASVGAGTETSAFTRANGDLVKPPHSSPRTDPSGRHGVNFFGLKDVYACCS